MYAAQHRSRSAKLQVTLRKAYGFGSSVMAMNPFDGQTLSVAFPGVTFGGMPARGADAAMRATAIRTSARLWLTLLAATALLGAGTPGASAATVTWSACSDLAGFECGTLDVPVNGQSPSAGSVRLAASRLVASDNPTRSAVRGLARGPRSRGVAVRRPPVRGL